MTKVSDAQQESFVVYRAYNKTAASVAKTLIISRENIYPGLFGVPHRNLGLGTEAPPGIDPGSSWQKENWGAAISSANQPIRFFKPVKVKDKPCDWWWLSPFLLLWLVGCGRFMGRNWDKCLNGIKDPRKSKWKRPRQALSTGETRFPLFPMGSCIL